MVLQDCAIKQPGLDHTPAAEAAGYAVESRLKTAGISLAIRETSRIYPAAMA
ncbi:MAG: hypothetical protein IT324_02420 [Anaerolineae bacterium]|nr:hypothetical protein [Anaerolineae bacterium]